MRERSLFEIESRARHLTLSGDYRAINASIGAMNATRAPNQTGVRVFA
jgi:hypothetical protein